MSISRRSGSGEPPLAPSNIKAGEPSSSTQAARLKENPSALPAGLPSAAHHLTTPMMRATTSGPPRRAAPNETMAKQKEKIYHGFLESIKKINTPEAFRISLNGVSRLPGHKADAFTEMGYRLCAIVCIEEKAGKDPQPVIDLYLKKINQYQQESRIPLPAPVLELKVAAQAGPSQLKVLATPVAAFQDIVKAKLSLKTVVERYAITDEKHIKHFAMINAEKLLKGNEKIDYVLDKFTMLTPDQRENLWKKQFDKTVDAVSDGAHAGKAARKWLGKTTIEQTQHLENTAVLGAAGQLLRKGGAGITIKKVAHDYGIELPENINKLSQIEKLRVDEEFYRSIMSQAQKATSEGENVAMTAKKFLLSTDEDLHALESAAINGQAGEKIRQGQAPKAVWHAHGFSTKRGFEALKKIDQETKDSK